MNGTKKIIIRGAIGNRNYGDDLLTHAICSYINGLPLASEVTIVSNSKYLLKHIDNVSIKGYYDLSGFHDLLLYAGGTQFASHSKKGAVSSNLSRLIKALRDIRLLLKKVKHKLLRQRFFNYKKLGIIGIGIGPFIEKDHYYRTSIGLLRQSDLLSVRDKLSSSICEENGLEYSLGSDLVFSSSETFKSVKRDQYDGIKNIGIVIRDWEHSLDNSSFIFKIKDLEYRGAKVLFYSFCKEKDKNGIDILKQNGLEKSLVIWNPDEMSFEGFAQLIAKNDILVTARYHGAIMASLLEIPFITIGIESKLSLIAELFEMSCWEYPYDIDDCLSKIQSIENNYEESVRKIALISNREKAKNKSMMNSLNELLKTL